MIKTPIAVLEEQVEIDYSQFHIKDEGYSDGEMPVPDAPGPGQLLAVGTDWVAVGSAVQYHLARVRIEAWDAEPDSQHSEWEVSDDFEFTCTTGRLALVTVAMGPVSDETITVGPPGTYRGRAYSKGRDEAAGQFEDRDEVDEGTEQYLIQFWPA